MDDQTCELRILFTVDFGRWCARGKPQQAKHVERAGVRSGVKFGLEVLETVSPFAGCR